MFSLTRFLDVDKKNRSLLLRCYFCFLCSGMMCTLIGALLPAVRAERGISYAFAGVLTSAHQMGNILAVLVAGFLPYMLGRKRSSVAMGSGNYIGLVLLTLTGSPVPLFAAYALTGVGRGTMSNITNVVVGQHAGNKAGALNLLHGVFAVGATISPFIAIAAGDPLWRVPCWVVAFFCLLSLILLGTSSLENKKEARPREESVVPRTADFWRITLILFCYISAESCLMNWLVTFVKDTGIIRGVSALSVQSLMWIMIMSGRFLCAWLSSKLDRNVLVLVLASLAAGFFILLINTQNKALTIAAVLGVGLSMGGIYPTTLSTMPERYARSTSATGICMSVACVGGVVTPLMVGLAADRTGDIRSGFVLVLGAFALLLAVILSKIAAERKRPAAGQEQPAAERKRPTAERKQPVAEQKQPAAKREQPAAERKRPATERKQPTAERERPAAERKRPAAEQEQPTAEREQPAAERKQPAAERKRPTAKQQPTTEREQPAAERKRPTAEREQPAAENKRPTTERERPAAPPKAGL